VLVWETELMRYDWKLYGSWIRGGLMDCDWRIQLDQQVQTIGWD
jgi:hypothetical protein